jgi:phage shock protein PspC (stress-responsive transcriptional regulator)
MASTRLTREKNGAILGGVCAGIANAYSIDVTLVRVGFVLATLVTSGLGVPFYIAAWLVMPSRDNAGSRATDIARSNVSDVVDTAKQKAADLRQQMNPEGVRKAAQDLRTAASSATQAARDAVGARPSASRAGTTGTPSWTPPPSNPRAGHGGFKPPRSTPPDRGL